MKIRIIAPITALVFIFVANCSSGSSSKVSDFVEACLSSSNLDRPICECTAKKAKHALSSKGFEFLIAVLNKNDPKTAELRPEMEIAEIAEAGMFMTRGPAECAGEMGSR